MAQRVDLDTDHLELEVDDADVATVWLDDPTASVNKISEDTLDAFSMVLDELEERDDVTGVVFISAKEASFVVGADLNMLDEMESPEEVREVSRHAHRLLSRVQDLDVPTVAAINGPCMGGGLELTLGCDYRLATTHDATKLALPEVQLGLLPGGGGTQYLPRLVGIQQALSMMLTGKNTYPEKARRIDLVDALIHPPGLHTAARMAARRLADGTLSIDRDGPSLSGRLLESNTVSRRVMYRQARKKTQSRTHGNYPAPGRIIDAVQTGMEQGLEEGLEVETEYFGELAFTPESKALVQLFFGKQDRENNPHEDEAHHVDMVGILGAGQMGAGIAEVTVSNGVDVVLKDQSLELATRGKKQVWTALEKKKDKGILNRFDRDKTAERVAPTGSYAPLAHCDFVIEAVPEDLDLKHQVLADVEEVVPDDAILASNTSSLPIADIAKGVEDPERVIGMHYFSPVSDVPLVEIITTEETSQEALATTYALALTQRKTVIVVNDGPGFYTTRILALYMNEALLMLEEGADIEAVDQAMTEHGFPMGPFELLDFVGIDVAGKITEVMHSHFPLDDENISGFAQELSENDLYGQKSGRGFYQYEETEENGDPDKEDVNEDVYALLGQTSRSAPAASIVQDRLTFTMINEAVRCLEDEILRSPMDGDVGAVFGLGFPPYLGGPFRYVDQLGASELVERMEDLASQYGSRLEPAETIANHATDESSFYE